MRIGEFTESFYPIVDGVGRVVWEYAHYFGTHGQETYVMAPMTDTGYRGDFPFEMVDCVGIPVLGSPQYRLAVPLDHHYLSRMRSIRFDIVHTHAPFTMGIEAVRTAAQQHCPLVGTFHSKYYDDFYKATHQKGLAELGVRYVAEFYEHCDEVWTVSRDSEQALRQYGYKGEIVLMGNGVSLRPQRPEDRDLARETFRLGEKPVLLFVGQMNWKKNIAHILEAAALLRQQEREFTLVLAGQGPDAKAIAQRAEELGLTRQLCLTGHITDTALLDGLYQSASLFTFPSLYDNAPMVLREAAAMGTPAVVTEGSGAAEVVQAGANGLVAQNSPEDLAQAMAWALDHPEKLKQMGETARKTIPVSWEQMMVQVQNRYEMLIENHPHGREHDRLRFVQSLVDRFSKDESLFLVDSGPLG